MKKVSVLIMVLTMLSVTVSAQMDNLSNISAKWVRSVARNAALDGGGDMVAFNPAGLAMLNDGIYISLSNQTLFRNPEHTYNLGAGAVTRTQDGIDPILPMLYGAYKFNQFAISTGVYISGGGAASDYPEGSLNTTLMGFKMLPSVAEGGYVTFKDEFLLGSSFYITIPLNLSYAFNDQLAVSVGGRYLMGRNKTEAGLTFTGSPFVSDMPLTIDYKNNASGIGGVFGIDYRPMDNLNLAIHYETKVKLEFEATDNSGTYKLEPDGTKSNRDLPANLAVGATYGITEKLMVAADFNYYFQSACNWDSITNPATGVKSDAAEIAGNSYKAGVGVTYKLNDLLELSGGVAYTDYMYDNMELYYTKLGLFEVLKYDNWSVGIGAGINLTENIQLDLGILRNIWKDETISSISAGGVPVDVKNSAYVLAIGLDFRF